MIRAFLALTPDAASAVAIQQWCALCWPAIERVVPVQNYHVTVAFLGDVSESQLQSISGSLQALEHDSFDMRLDCVGYWPDTTTLWLGSKNAPASVNTLVSRCSTIVNRAGVRVDTRRYLPHITLARRTQNPPAQPLIEPDFLVRFESIELYQSIRDRDGVRYVELKSWMFRQ